MNTYVYISKLRLAYVFIHIRNVLLYTYVFNTHVYTSKLSALPS